jgi:hypothetical protein
MQEYPILDEEALSEMENEEAWEWWDRDARRYTIDEPDNEPDKGAWNTAFSDAFSKAFENSGFSEDDYPNESEVIEALAVFKILEEDNYEEETCDCGGRTLHREKDPKYPWLVCRWCPECDKKFYMEPVDPWSLQVGE